MAQWCEMDAHYLGKATLPNGKTIILEPFPAFRRWAQAMIDHASDAEVDSAKQAVFERLKEMGEDERQGWIMYFASLCDA